MKRSILIKLSTILLSLSVLSSCAGSKKAEVTETVPPYVISEDSLKPEERQLDNDNSISSGTDADKFEQKDSVLNGEKKLTYEKSNTDEGTGEVHEGVMPAGVQDENTGNGQDAVTSNQDITGAVKNGDEGKLASDEENKRKDAAVEEAVDGQSTIEEDTLEETTDEQSKSGDAVVRDATDGQNTVKDATGEENKVADPTVEDATDSQSTGEEVTAEDNALEEATAEESEVNEEQDWLVPTTRNEAGLTTVPRVDFSHYNLNPYLQPLVAHPYSCTDEDFRKGVIGTDFLIITERFKEPIIEDISIGDSITKVTDILGQPGSILQNVLFYKTKDYYIGFKGKERVEQIIFFRHREQQYPPDILEQILVASGEEGNNGVLDILSSSDAISRFIDWDGHIHGGGWYAYSRNGIYIEEFDGNFITVYNNFQGELYGVQSDTLQYDVIYTDIDYLMKRMVWALDGYAWENKLFDGEGKVSPTGSLNSVYVWNYSESYYFIIRTMDHSQPDYYIHVPVAGEYYWLNDHYILYTDFYSSIPMILRADRSDGEVMNVLAETGMIEQDDGYYSFEIQQASDGYIVFYDGNDGKEYRVRYSFDLNGEIQLDSTDGYNIQ